MYQLSSFNGKNTHLVDDPLGRYVWQQPVPADLPYSVEDLDPSNTTKGEMGTTFQIKMNKKVFSNSATITYDKMNGVELWVTEDPILETGDGFIYTVKIKNPGEFQYLDNAYLTPETKWFRTTSDMGEYGQMYDEVFLEAGAKEMMNFVGNSGVDFHYKMSLNAVKMLEAGISTPGAVVVNEIWNLDYKSIPDPSIRNISNINELKAKQGFDWCKDMAAKGLLTTSWITKVEATGLAKMARDVENDLMWGKGGSIQTGYGETLRSSMGLWKQLDNAFKKVYNIGSFSIDMFTSEINNFFYGKVDLVGPDPNRTIVVQTGRAGMELVNKKLAEEAVKLPFQLSGTDLGVVKSLEKSNAMKLHYGYSFTSYTIPFLANIQFVYNPAFDPAEANNIENPLINGYRLSSYSFIVFDITDGANDNIILLKKKWDNELRWRYINYKCDYMGRKYGFQSSGSNGGYEVFMDMPKPAIFVKDPTKVLKIVARNPITGFSL